MRTQSLKVEDTLISQSFNRAKAKGVIVGAGVVGLGTIVFTPEAFAEIVYNLSYSDLVTANDDNVKGFAKGLSFSEDDVADTPFFLLPNQSAGYNVTGSTVGVGTVLSTDNTVLADYSTSTFFLGLHNQDDGRVSAEFIFNSPFTSGNEITTFNNPFGDEVTGSSVVFDSKAPNSVVDIEDPESFLNDLAINLADYDVRGILNWNGDRIGAASPPLSAEFSMSGNAVGVPEVTSGEFLGLVVMSVGAWKSANAVIPKVKSLIANRFVKAEKNNVEIKEPAVHTPS